jgi:hypothetical protein
MVRFHVDKDFCAKGCHVSCIKGEWPFECFVCQEQRILMTWTEHVEVGTALWCDPAPVCYGKRFGKARHASKEMIVLGADDPFGRVCALDVQWSVLDVCLLGGNKGFNVFGSFVVEFLEERFEAAKSEPGVDVATVTEKFFFGTIFDGNRINVIGVLDVNDNNVCMVVVGCDRKAASLVCEEIAIDFVDGHENEMCARVAGFLSDIFHGVIEEVGCRYLL